MVEKLTRHHTEPELWQIAETVLTERQLEIVRLVWRRKLSIRQTAAMLDISPSTVTSHLRTARHRIANELRKAAA